MSDTKYLSADELESLREAGISIDEDPEGVLALKNTLILEGMSEEDAWYTALSQLNTL